jgi:O-antigen ligase
MGVFTRIHRSELIMFAWGGLIALSMMRVWSSLFFTPIYLFALLALLSADTRKELRMLAGRLYLLPIYFLWAVLSLLWAEFPGVSWQAVRGDILIPCLAFIASFHAFRMYGQAARIEFFLSGVWCVFLVGSALTYFYFGPSWLNPNWLDKMFDSVGYYSTYLFMLAGISLPFLRKNSRLFFYPLLVGLLFMTHQRVAWVVFPVVVIADLVLHARHRFSRGGFLLAFVLVLGFSFAMMKAELSGRPANAFNPEQKASGVIEHLANNERLGPWQAWFARGLESPVIGAGFGRDNVKAHFSRGEEWPDQQLHHGHNLLLNNFLQLGLLGVCLFIAANSQLLYLLFRQRQAIATAGALIVMFFLLRNMFDDFSFKRLLVVYGLFLGVCFQGLMSRGAELLDAASPESTSAR